MPPETTTVERGRGGRRWVSLGLFALAQLMVVLDVTIVTIALPSIQRALRMSTAGRQWTLTAYALAFAGLLLLGGRLADYIGRKRVFVIGLVGFAAASALGGEASGPSLLFAARALQGAFAALMAPAALSLISVTFTEARERATAFGVYGAVAAGGAVIGLVAGGALTQYASWRWCLLVNVPISLATAIGALRVVRESRAAGRTRYDVAGAATSAGGLVAAVYGFNEASVQGWTYPFTVALLGLAVILLLLFVLVELRAPQPLLPLRVALERNRGGAFLASFLAGMGLFGTFLFLTYYLQGIHRYLPLEAGVAFLPFSGGIIVSAGVASRLLPRVGPRVLLGGGFLMAAAGGAWLTRLGVTSSVGGLVVPDEVLTGLGLGLAFVTMSSTALVGVEEQDAGVASGLLNAGQQAGGSLGVALLNTLFVTAASGYLAARRGMGRPPLPVVLAAQVHGYAVGFWASAVVMAVAAVVTMVLVEKTVPAAVATGPTRRGSPARGAPARGATARGAAGTEAGAT